MNLQGCYTALVTPFRDGQVDFEALRTLVDRQIAAGIDGLVPVGTTGESPTLSMTEHRRVIETVIEQAAGRCTIIAGTGANATAEALELTRHAKEAGADATLQVTPYYNKPTQEGLYRHFAAVADQVGLPVVLYNVPGRTGREIAVDTVARLAQNSNIVALKEAGGSADRVSQVLGACDITVLSGDDGLTFPMMALGGKGVISVASNLMPGDVTAMTHLALNGQWDEARTEHYRLYPLFDVLFVETNPIPIKAAMAMLGLVDEEYRLPLCPLQPASRDRVREVLGQLGLGV